MMNGQSHIDQVQTDLLKKERKAVVEILERGVRSGELQVEHPDKAAYVMSLAPASIEYQWSLDGSCLALPELVDTITQDDSKWIGRHSL